MEDADTNAFAFREFQRALGERAPNAYVIADLDETLWLRNTTERFIDHAWPKFIIVPLLALLQAVAPWKLLRVAGVPQHRAAFIWRDWLRVLTVLIVSPWSLVTWWFTARRTAAEFANQELIEELEKIERDRVVVSTFGFGFIARPIVHRVLPRAKLVSSPYLFGWKRRSLGKMNALRQRFSDGELASAIYITDHAENDADIIKGIPKSFVWRSEQAKFETAGTGDYSPFRYTLAGKHAGRHHVLRVFLGEDFLALALASLFVSTGPLSLGIGLLLLTLSFFIVFEIGYWENDKLGLEREDDPNLTDARLDSLSIMSPWRAWLMALIFGAGGVGCVALSGVTPLYVPGVSLPIGPFWITTLIMLLAWAVYLVANRLLFAFFNRIDKASRPLFYLPMQLAKGVGIVWLLAIPVHIVGLFALAAQALARWITYVAYRSGGDKAKVPVRLIRCLLILVFIPILWAAHGTPEIAHATTVAVLIWAVFMSRAQLTQILKGLHFLKPKAQAGE